MISPVEKMRHAMKVLVEGLDADDIFWIRTSRDLIAIVDAKFSWQVSNHRWYAVKARGDHLYPVADIKGRRVGLQRFVLSLEHPDKTLDDFKNVSFANKISFDCRLVNLEYRVGRQAVMRNRKPKRNTSSAYKGVMKKLRNDGRVFWRGQIRGPYGTMSLGSFDDEKWAALVYDAAAYLLFEGSAYYNFPELCPHEEALTIAAHRIERFKNLQARKKEEGSDGSADQESA